MDINSVFSEKSNEVITIIIDTPLVMKVYKKYLLLHVIFTIINAVTMIVGKPLMIYKISIGICTGFLSAQNEFVTRMFFALWINSVMWLATALTLIHVERYFTIHKGYGCSNRYCWNMTAIVIFYVVINIIISLGVVITSIYGDIYLGGSTVETYLRENVIGGIDFLQKYPGAVLLNNQYTSPWILTFYGCLLLATVSTSPPLFTFLCLNICTGFKMINMANFPERTRRIQITVLRTSIIQVFLVSVLGIIPVMLLLATVISKANFYVKMEYSLAVLQFHPLIDNIVVILCVKPYRDFVNRLIHRNKIEETIIPTKITVK
ncbi:hypothetical protein FO519_001863 [Halicephalobus sp. NKZ332]|nr:hypothetical protein FO519_001863 [Halicephalobus sp. NKZ332]